MNEQSWREYVWLKEASLDQLFEYVRPYEAFVGPTQPNELWLSGGEHPFADHPSRRGLVVGVRPVIRAHINQNSIYAPGNGSLNASHYLEVYFRGGDRDTSTEVSLWWKYQTILGSRKLKDVPRLEWDAWLVRMCRPFGWFV